MNAGIKRVNYYAPKFGFVGWETFSRHDDNIMEKVIQHDVYQMSKMIDEDVDYKIVEM